MKRLLLSDSAAVIALAVYLGIPFELMPRALRNLLLMAWGAFVRLQIAVGCLSILMSRARFIEEGALDES